MGSCCDGKLLAQEEVQDTVQRTGWKECVMWCTSWSRVGPGHGEWESGVYFELLTDSAFMMLSDT